MGEKVSAKEDTVNNLSAKEDNYSVTRRIMCYNGQRKTPHGAGLGVGMGVRVPLWIRVYRLWRLTGLRFDYLIDPIGAYRLDQRNGVGCCPRRKTAARRYEALRQRGEGKYPLR